MPSYHQARDIFIKFLYVFLLGILVSCNRDQNQPSSSTKEQDKSTKIYDAYFQSLLDSADVVGSVLIYDMQKNTYYSNDFDWAYKGKLPASTFKIVNSIIGLETGILKNGTTMFEWDGEDRWSRAWEKDLMLEDAFQLSCVPCYQELARNIGLDKMNEFVQKLNYGNIQIDSNNLSSILK